MVTVPSSRFCAVAALHRVGVARRLAPIALDALAGLAQGHGLQFALLARFLVMGVTAIFGWAAGLSVTGPATVRHLHAPVRHLRCEDRVQQQHFKPKVALIGDISQRDPFALNLP